jgi:hypothetical protein
VFAVGDGLVVVRTADENLDLLLAPAGGPAAPIGGTTLLTSADVRTSARHLVARIPDLTGVTVSSDGLHTLLVHYEAAQPVRADEAVFERLFGMAETGQDALALTRLLTGRQVSDLTEDDRTLVVAVPK